MNPIRRKSETEGASICKMSLVRSRRRSIKELVTLFGYVAVFMNAIVATTAGVVDCRCEYPNENHYDYFDGRRHNLASYKDEHRDYVVVDGQRLIPWDHAACRQVEFVCPEDYVDGTSWDHVCVQREANIKKWRRGGMRWKKTNKNNLGITSLIVVKGKTNSRDKRVGMAMGGKKSKNTIKKGTQQRLPSEVNTTTEDLGRTKGMNGGLKMNIFKRANRRAMQMIERELKSKTINTRLRNKEIVVLPPDNPLCKHETPGPAATSAIDRTVSASLSGRPPSDAPTSSTSTRPSSLFENLSPALSSAAPPSLPPTTVPSGVPFKILSSEPTSEVQAITAAPSPSFRPTIEAQAIIAAVDAERNPVLPQVSEVPVSIYPGLSPSTSSDASSSVAPTDYPSYAETAFPTFTWTWAFTSDSMAPSASTVPSTIPTFTSTSAVPSTSITTSTAINPNASITPSTAINPNASITPSVSSYPSSAPSTISSNNPTTTPSSTQSAPSATPTVASPSGFPSIESKSMTRPSGNLNGAPSLSPTLSPSNADDASSSVAPTHNPSSAESAIPTFTPTWTVASDSIIPSASTAPSAIPTFSSTSAVPSVSVSPSASSIAPSTTINPYASITPSVSFNPSSTPSTIVSSNLTATPAATQSVLSLSSLASSAAPTVSSPSGFLSVESFASSSGNNSAATSLTPSAPPTSPPSPTTTSNEPSSSPSRAVDNPKNLLS